MEFRTQQWYLHHITTLHFSSIYTTSLLQIPLIVMEAYLAHLSHCEFYFTLSLIF